MSLWRFQMQAEIDTVAHANTIWTALSNQLAATAPFITDRLVSAIGGAIQVGTPLVNVDIRFQAQDPRDWVRDYVLTQVSSHPVVKTWINAYDVTWHRCTHLDGTFVDCTTTDYGERSWVR